MPLSWVYACYGDVILVLEITRAGDFYAENLERHDWCKQCLSEFLSELGAVKMAMLLGRGGIPLTKPALGSP